jgi:hypothetical protein
MDTLAPDPSLADEGRSAENGNLLFESDLA